jgi:hypothetical protein
MIVPVLGVDSEKLGYRMIENMGRSYTLVGNPQHAIQFHLEGHDLQK